MTRKDFGALADILKREKDLVATPTTVGIVMDIALAVANYCESDNPHFDRERFLIACGVRHGG